MAIRSAPPARYGRRYVRRIGCSSVTTTVATRRLRWTWLIVALIALAVVGAWLMIEAFVVSSPVPIRTAERFLQGPPTFSYAGEHGQPGARCHHTDRSDGFRRCLHVDLSIGDAYRCTVSSPQDSAGASASCASRPFRRS